MQLEQADAIAVRTLRYSDTSLIVTWLTRQYGILSTMAKGALRPKQALAGKVDLFVEGTIHFQRSRSGSMHTLREVEVVSRHEELCVNYGRQLCLAYFYELLSLVSEPEAEMADCYELYRKALHYLKEHEPTVRLVERYEHNVLERLGLNHPHKDAGRVWREMAGGKKTKTEEALRGWLRNER